MVKTSWNEFRLRKIPEGISMGQLSIKYPGSFQIEVTLAHNLDHFVIRELLHHQHGNQLVPCVIGCLISNLFSLLCPLGPQVGETEKCRVRVACIQVTYLHRGVQSCTSQDPP